MTDNVGEWLEQLKQLQAELQAAREAQQAAEASAANWRQRYEIEAKQRRSDVQEAQATIMRLRQELEHDLAQAGVAEAASDATQARLKASLMQITELDAARELVLKLTLERDRLRQALQVERTEHAKTRQNLTTALGDTVDLLAQERAARAAEQNNQPQSPNLASDR